MNITEFVDQFKKDHPAQKACYIAVMPIDGQYDLEVETVPQETIGAVYRTDESDLEKARRIADRLDAALGRQGVKVFKTREAWEDSVAPEDE